MRKYPLVLSTGTAHIHYNGSQLHNLESMQKLAPHPRAELGPKTAAQYGVAHRG